MKVEILFPEVGNLCGDLMNIRYLRQCCPELEVVETDLKSRPAFLEGGVDLVYMGSATEKGLELMVKALTPYREELADRVDGGQRMLVTGNALDALGEYVQSDQGLRFDGLGLLPTHAEYQMMNRHNSFFLGTYGTGMEIVGFKSLFGHTYGADDPGTGLFKVVRGVGRRPGSLVEGFRRGGLMATYLTGPLLVLNPPFTKQLLRELGAEDTLAFEEAAMEAYLGALRRVALFHGMEDRELLSMLDCLGARLRQYSKGDVIFHAGDPATHLGAVLTGQVQVSRTKADGQRVVMGEIRPGGLFAESFACARAESLPVTVTAAADAAVLLIDCGRISAPCSAASLGSQSRAAAPVACT